MRASSWALLLGLAAAVACQPSSNGAAGGDDPAAARAAINAANAQGVTAFNGRDRAALLAGFEENATMMRLAAPDEIGRHAIDSGLGANWEATRDSGVTLTWKADSIEVRGNYAYEIGRGMQVRRGSGPAGPDTMRTRYITFWHKGSDGQWRVSRDFTVRVPSPTK